MFHMHRCCVAMWELSNLAYLSGLLLARVANHAGKKLPRQKPSTFERTGVYIVARVNRDEQSYWVTTIDLPTALHPTLASTLRPSSLTKRAVFIFTSIVFTQRRIIRTTNNHHHTWENPYCNHFYCKKALESVMCTDIGCRLGTAISSPAIIGLVEILNSGVKG